MFSFRGKEILLNRRLHRPSQRIRTVAGLIHCRGADVIRQIFASNVAVKKGEEVCTRVFLLTMLSTPSLCFYTP